MLNDMIKRINYLTKACEVKKTKKQDKQRNMVINKITFSDVHFKKDKGKNRNRFTHTNKQLGKLKYEFRKGACS